MKGIRFYELFRDKRAGVSEHTCIAVAHEQRHFDAVSGWVYDAIGPLMVDAAPNTSALCGCGVSAGFLAESCRRVSEARAREIHPALVARLRALAG